MLQDCTSSDTAVISASCSVACQTDHDADELKELKRRCTELEADNISYSKEKAEVDKRLNSLLFNEQAFQNEDGKVRFYTGLTNWNLLSTLFTFIMPHLPTSSSLSPFEIFILTLMRLRLATPIQDLGNRFRVHPSTVSRMFASVLEILYARLKFLIVWPERDVLRKTLPMDFRLHCPKCVAIIDCFEVFIDRPSDLLARAQTYSNYKHHNTVKYLIAVTPQGTVSFISEGWGGRVSDKHLTENSRFLNNLLPGDTVLADRGFNIQESVGLYRATVTLPAFTKGKKQLTGIEVEQTRSIANIRIHVERVIGNIRKKFSFLSITQPIYIDHLISRNKNPTILDMAVTVCCALNNLCNSVIPSD